MYEEFEEIEEDVDLWSEAPEVMRVAGREAEID
jgi:hypothetical protein